MKLIWVFIAVGGIIGGYLPTLFGDKSAFSLWGIVGGTIGSLLGIWLFLRLDLE